MLWFMFFFTLVACMPAPLSLEKRGLSCVGFRGRPAELPSINLNVRGMVEANVFEDTPTLTALPLTSWSGSDAGHHFAYRAWRTTGVGGTFWAHLEVQVTGPANVFVTFGAQSTRQGRDPGLSRVEPMLAEGSGSSRYPRRTSYSLQIGTIHQNIDYTVTGNWRL